MFPNILRLFRHRRPCSELQEHYLELHLLGEEIHKELKQLHKLHSSLVKDSSQSEGGKTGKIGLHKTLFIKEGLLPRLKRLTKVSEQRFEHVTSQVNTTSALFHEEREEIRKIISFLEEIQMKIKQVQNVETSSKTRKLEKVEFLMRELDLLAQEFYNAQAIEKDLIQRVVESQIKPVLADVYKNTRRIKSGEFVYEVTLDQLREIEDEARRINSAGDPNFKIMWRRWWRHRQIPERDAATPIKEPHVDVVMKMFGGPKKDIHLLVAA